MNYYHFVVILAFSHILGSEAQAPPDASKTSVSGGGFLSAMEEDTAKFDRYKEKVCSLHPEFGGGDAAKAPQWNNVLMEEEVLELAFINMAYGLTADSVAHMKDKMGWKKTVIDQIALVTKATCKDSVVSDMFLNVAKNLFLYYMMKMSQSQNNNSSMPMDSMMGNDTVKMGHWKEIMMAIASCAKSVEPIEINLDCGKAMTFVGRDSVEYPIVETNERFDVEAAVGGDVGIDVVIDTVWWMFSTTYARCYANFYPNEDVILLYLQRFREDFLEGMADRWRNAGPLVEHFDLIFGPYDFAEAKRNVRKCSAAAYQYEGIPERQLVRPVTVLVDNQRMRNMKET